MPFVQLWLELYQAFPTRKNRGANQNPLFRLYISFGFELSGVTRHGDRNRQDSVAEKKSGLTFSVCCHLDTQQEKQKKK